MHPWQNRSNGKPSAHTLTCTQKHMCTHTAHACVHTYAQKCSARSHTLTLMQKHTCTHSQKHTCTRTSRSTRAHTYAHTYSQHVYTYAHAHTQKHSHTRAQVDTLMHMTVSQLEHGPAFADSRDRGRVPLRRHQTTEPLKDPGPPALPGLSCPGTTSVCTLGFHPPARSQLPSGKV